VCVRVFITVMFADPAPHSPMRLIDFGSGCIDSLSPSSSSKHNNNDDDDLPMHTTFAGSAFYISPELFQRSYNRTTDVWSAGVALYVLVAGYPADELQKAFNILQTGGKGRNLRKLPNLPEDLPDSFYEMLEAALTYRHKKRPRAQQLLECDFVQFHKQLSTQDAAAVVPLSLDEVASAAAAAAPDPMVSFGGSLRDSSASNPSQGGRGGTSMRLKGSVRKHSIFLDFKNFERSLTAVLATMLSKRELEQLVKILTERVTIQEPFSDKDATAAAAPDGSSAAPTVESGSSQIPAASTPPGVRSQESSMTLDGAGAGPPPSNELRLGVILISELKAIIRDELRSSATIETIEKLPNEKLYSSFAYHVTLLHEFLFVSGGGARSSAGRRRVKRTNSFSHGLKPGVRTMTGSNPSIRSGSGSLRGGTATMMTTNRSTTTTGGAMPASGAASHVKTIPHSVHGSSVFASLRARNKTQSVPDFGASAGAAGAGGAGSGLA
jgi:Protein kinase domain